MVGTVCVPFEHKFCAILQINGRETEKHISKNFERLSVWTCYEAFDRCNGLALFYCSASVVLLRWFALLVSMCFLCGCVMMSFECGWNMVRMKVNMFVFFSF